MSQPQTTILAHILRDIPTLGGTVRRGEVLVVVDGKIGGDGSGTREIKSDRANLGMPSGGVRLSCARLGEEFELVEVEVEQNETLAVTADDRFGIDDV